MSDLVTLGSSIGNKLVEALEFIPKFTKDYYLSLKEKENIMTYSLMNCKMFGHMNEGSYLDRGLILDINGILILKGSKIIKIMKNNDCYSWNNNKGCYEFNANTIYLTDYTDLLLTVVFNGDFKFYRTIGPRFVSCSESKMQPDFNKADQLTLPILSSESQNRYWETCVIDYFHLGSLKIIKDTMEKKSQEHKTYVMHVFTKVKSGLSRSLEKICSIMENALGPDPVSSKWKQFTESLPYHKHNVNEKTTIVSDLELTNDMVSFLSMLIDYDTGCIENFGIKNKRVFNHYHKLLVDVECNLKLIDGKSCLK